MSYESLEASWMALRTLTREGMKADRRAAEVEIAKRLAALQATANASRLNLLAAAAAAAAGAATNPLAALGLATAGKQAIGAQRALDDMKERAKRLRIDGATHEAGVLSMLNQIEDRIRGEFSRGRDTPKRFAELSEQWRKISVDSEQLRSEIDEFGSTPPWQSEVSAEAYSAAVVPQKLALKELSQVAANTSVVTTGISDLQQAIFVASYGSIKACFMTVSRAAKNSRALAQGGAFFHTTLTARASLESLNAWITMGIAMSWLIPSMVLTLDLSASAENATTLTQGWPELTDRAPQGAAASDVADVQQRDAGGVASSTTHGQTGGALGL